VSRFLPHVSAEDPVWVSEVPSDQGPDARGEFLVLVDEFTPEGGPRDAGTCDLGMTKVQAPGWTSISVKRWVPPPRHKLDNSSSR